MKKFISFLLLLCCFGNAGAQLVIKDGAYFIVKSGTDVIVNDGIVSDNGTIDNDGSIYNPEDLINNTSTLFSSGSSGTFIFNGTTLQEISGNHDAGFYGVLKIDNAAGVAITGTSTGADQTVNGLLLLSDGMLILNEFNLSIGSTDPSGIGSTRYVKTNGTGSVYRNVPADGTTLILFPVGNSSYNPIILKNSATASGDDYGVRVIDNEPANSNTPHLVNRSWKVTETIPGGSQLSVTPQWKGSQELADFNRDNCGVGLTTNAGSTYVWRDHGPAAGANPYTQTGSVFYGVGTFAVSDYYFAIPDNLTVSSTTIGNAESDCFDAKQTIIVAGDGTIVEVLSGGEAIFVAGGTIYLRYGFSSQEGSYTHAYITLNDQFCGSQPLAMVAYQQDPVEQIVDIPDIISNPDDLSINIYPNPTSGLFNIDFFNFTEKAEIHVMNFQGQEVFKKSNQNQLTLEMDISRLPDGIYMIIIKTNDQNISGKVIKS